MSCYFIANIEIHDRAEYQKYLDGFDEIFAKYHGEVLAVDEEPALLEGAWPYTRVVLIRFADQKEARRWYDSVEYQALVKHRHGVSRADIILAQARD
jgi:uncharacterized protein (DUF1330 family)